MKHIEAYKNNNINIPKPALSYYYSSHFLDFAVGRIKKQDFPKEYAEVHFKLSVERFRRCLDANPEYGSRLSDYDRSLLWKRNHYIAAGLLASKVI